MKVHSITLNTEKGDIIIPLPENVIFTYNIEQDPYDPLITPKVQFIRPLRKLFEIKGEYDNIIVISEEIHL